MSDKDDLIPSCCDLSERFSQYIGSRAAHVMSDQSDCSAGTGWPIGSFFTGENFCTRLMLIISMKETEASTGKLLDSMTNTRQKLKITLNEKLQFNLFFIFNKYM